MPTVTELPAAEAAGLDEVIRRIIERADPVGLAVGVVRDGRLVYTHCHGLADVELNRAVEPTTPFRIGSISKTFTGIGIMQLRQRGLLDLDEPITKYLSAFPWVSPRDSRPATLREVMTHTSGVGELRSWRDMFLATTYGGILVKHGKPIPRLADYYRRGLRPEVAPGAKWAYANHAVAALGQVIEDVSGQPFADYMRANIFDRLGMSGTDFVSSPRAGRPAAGYRLRRGKPRKLPWFEIVVAPAGSAISNIEDMARFAAALTNGGGNQGGSVIDPTALEEMFAAQWTPDPRLPGQGLVFLRDEVVGHRVVWHDGGCPGFICSMLVAPDDRLAVLVLNNGSSAIPHDVADGVLRQLLGAPQLAAELARGGAGPVPADAAELTGDYKPAPGLLTNLRHWGMFGGRLRVEDHNGQLSARGRFGPMRRGVPLQPTDPDDPLRYAGIVSFKRTSSVPLQLAFQRNSGGIVDRVAGSLLLPFQFRKQ